MLVLERDKEPGGILNQCIHNGFGLHYFKEELTGPEYAGRFIQRASELGVEILLDTMVLSVEEDHTVRAVNCRDGLLEIQAGAVVLAMGCRERTRGAIAIPGDRPAGILQPVPPSDTLTLKAGWWAAGGYSGQRRHRPDYGAPHDAGGGQRIGLCGTDALLQWINRNIVQCLKDYGIPLYLSHTITNIVGRERVEQVVVSEVGADRRPIPGTEITFDCDTVLLSVGLIPENELTRAAGISIDSRTSGAVVFENMETVTPGIFSCGNVVHVHDLVDFVTAESRRAGAAAARYAAAGQSSPALSCLEVQNGAGVTYTVPQKIRPAHVEKGVDVFFRVDNVYRNRRICVTSAGEELCSFSREHMAPGEMEHILLPKRLLERAGDGELTVSLAAEKGAKE